MFKKIVDKIKILLKLIKTDIVYTACIKVIKIIFLLRKISKKKQL